MPAAVVELHRSGAQRRFGAASIALVLGMSVVFGWLMWVVIANLIDGDAPIWTLVVLPLSFLALWQKGLPLARGGWRLASSRPGRLSLEEDRLIVTDLSVFTEPVVVLRDDIESISRAPSGVTAMGVFGDARKEGASLISVVAERPDLLVRFRQPRTLPARHHLGDLHGNAAIRPPLPGVPTNGLWLRMEDTRTVVLWHRRDTSSRWGDDL